MWPVFRENFVVLVYAHSKWLEGAVVSSPSSQQAICVLRQMFATHSFPEVLVSDNGLAVTCSEFFVQANGFRHVRGASYHAATNGLAERDVQTYLRRRRVTLIHVQYRLTSHSTMGQSPAELLLGRKPRSHLDFLFPSLKHRVRQIQERQKEDHDRNASHRAFVVGKP